MYRRCGRVSRRVDGVDSYTSGGVSGAISGDGGPSIRTGNHINIDDRGVIIHGWWFIIVVVRW